METASPNQIVQLSGAALILIAYGLLQSHRLRTSQPIYSWLNLVGAALLAVEACRTHQWGFLLLEGTWALISAIVLCRQYYAVSKPARHT
ncbi:MAG: hypothetical protein ACKVX7_07655 [Planctomycetota bacterium]